MARGINMINTVAGGGGSSYSSAKKLNDTIEKGTSEKSKIKFTQINLDDITPRSINKYKQSRIERLAKSIKNTNNRLIHPITVVKASDLPKDHEVLKKFEAQGVDVDGLKYIIVSGERRYRAFLLLREEEKNRKGKDVWEMAENPFDTITANILSPLEARNEKAFYEDSNIESRQLTTTEALLHVKTAIDEILDPQDEVYVDKSGEKKTRKVSPSEKKYEAILEMQRMGCWDSAIPQNVDEADNLFNKNKYCQYYLESELGITTIGKSKLDQHLAILSKCSENVIDAIIADEYTEGAARNITKLSHEEQDELLNLYKTNKVEYDIRLDELRTPEDKKKKRVDHIDGRKEFDKVKKYLEKERILLKGIADKLGQEDKKKMNDGIKHIDSTIKTIEEICSSLK